MTNIKFNFLYRDAGNNKLWGAEIFTNSEELELKSVDARIRQCLIDCEYFDPEPWGLERLVFEKWVPSLDHTWHEYESVELTEEISASGGSVGEFLDKIEHLQISKKGHGRNGHNTATRHI